MSEKSNLDGPRPAVTFVVCTKDRPQLLERLLTALRPALFPDDELLVVDNSLGGSAESISQRAGARWVHELHSGSSWARNRGYREAKNQIVAYLDDDCEPDVVWATELLRPFGDPEVGVVTGSVLASRADLAVPRLIDADFSYHRGWRPRRFQGSTGTMWSPCDAWRVGGGVHMAWRKYWLEQIGGFDPALGAGVPTGAGEDIDALRRALCAGATVCYQPTALVWHAHPEHIAELKQMLGRYALGLGAHSAKMVLEEQQWKGAPYLAYICCWQMLWGLRLAFVSGQKARGRIPLGSWFVQPLQSIWGMIEFLRFRHILRHGEGPSRPSRAKQTRHALAPPPSGIADAQMEIARGIPDLVVTTPIRLLLRRERRPVLALEIPAGESISRALDRQLPPR
jgi:GT2 family glycosyltransferase